jgi:hypothetical protein
MALIKVVIDDMYEVEVVRALEQYGILYEIEVER